MGRLRRRQPNARKPRIPRDSRTVPVCDETSQGNGTWYNCWWCGFPNSDQRSALGDESTPNGVTHAKYAASALGAEPGIRGATKSTSSSGSEYREGGSPSANLMLGGITIKQKTPVIRSDSDGNPITVLHYYTASADSGCSFCGSMNWRGDF